MKSVEFVCRFALCIHGASVDRRRVDTAMLNKNNLIILPKTEASIFLILFYAVSSATVSLEFLFGRSCQQVLPLSEMRRLYVLVLISLTVWYYKSSSPVGNLNQHSTLNVRYQWRLFALKKLESV